MFTKEINKIALSSNDDKRLQTFDRIALHLYGANIEKVCKTELINAIYNIKLLILMLLQMKTKQNIIENAYTFHTIHREY